MLIFNIESASVDKGWSTVCYSRAGRRAAGNCCALLLLCSHNYDCCSWWYRCLQCFDAVGWEAGRHPTCRKLSGVVLFYHPSRVRCRFAYGLQLLPLPLTVSCFSKSRLALVFWYWLTRVASDQGPLNGCCCWCRCDFVTAYMLLLVPSSTMLYWQLSTCFNRLLMQLALIVLFECNMCIHQIICKILGVHS